MPRHILVFGGTSPVGIDFSRAALRDGHTLTLYVRNPSKIPAEIADKVNVVVGQLTDAHALEKAVGGGANTVVSFIGPVMDQLKKGTTPITDGYRLILPLLQKHNYSRGLFSSTSSYHVPEDSFSFLYSLVVNIIYLFFNAAYKEINSFSPLITALPADKLAWTIFRLPNLKNGEAKPVKAGFVGQGVGLTIERKGVAEWVLAEMEEGKWIGKSPAIANA
ncbi:hypothetical protein B0J11DRAFT_520027 [Dendryphion nanum]|uniref:NAD(P)-binding domain-containing protein n=1 Tax=Dendryphion nanum TaxID=256645 RepID=A0A9P9EBC0_9PLEO|nr:hypothetical protein B0J11DRAFT_520027 [Dendryphion nanum]